MHSDAVFPRHNGVSRHRCHSCPWLTLRAPGCVFIVLIPDNLTQQRSRQKEKVSSAKWSECRSGWYFFFFISGRMLLEQISLIFQNVSRNVIILKSGRRNVWRVIIQTRLTATLTQSHAARRAHCRSERVTGEWNMRRKTRWPKGWGSFSKCVSNLIHFYKKHSICFSIVLVQQFTKML